MVASHLLRAVGPCQLSRASYLGITLFVASPSKHLSLNLTIAATFSRTDIMATTHLFSSSY